MLRRLDGGRGDRSRAAGAARLRAIGRAYVEFALAEPGLFSVAFCPRDRRPVIMEDAAPYLLLGQVLDELVAAGALSPEGRLGADVACWAAVHGLSVLLLDGPLRDLPPEVREAVLAKVIATVELGLTGSMGSAGSAPRRSDRSRVRAPRPSRLPVPIAHRDAAVTPVTSQGVSCRSSSASGSAPSATSSRGTRTRLYVDARSSAVLRIAVGGVSATGTGMPLPFPRYW